MCVYWLAQLGTGSDTLFVVLKDTAATQTAGTEKGVEKFFHENWNFQGNLDGLNQWINFLVT